jgi:uroporphyrinogen-III decarboxylase
MPSRGDALKGLLYAKGLRFINLNPDSRQVASMMGKPDYVPPIAAQIHVHAMTVAKADPMRFHRTDGRYNTLVQVYVQKWYEFEQPLAIAPEAYNYEVEALGGKLSKSEHHMTTVDQQDPLIKTPEDIDKVKVPIERDAGRVPFVIDSMRTNPEVFGVCPTGIFCAPFSFVCGIHSYVRLVKDIRKNPEFVHRLFKWSIDEVLLPYLALLKRETGYTEFLGADAWSAIPNTNREILEEFVFPYNAYLREEGKKMGLEASVAATADYCEEDPNRFDPELMKWAWKKFSTEWMGRAILLMGMGKPELWPMNVMKDYIRENKSLMWTPSVMAGCSASYMRDSTPEQIAEYVKRIIDNLGRDGRLSFFGIQIPADTPQVNVHTFVQSIKTYGKYPIAEDLDEVDFKIPDFEPFEDWYNREVAEGRAVDFM